MKSIKNRIACTFREYSLYDRICTFREYNQYTGNRTIRDSIVDTIDTTLPLISTNVFKLREISVSRIGNRYCRSVTFTESHRCYSFDRNKPIYKLCNTTNIKIDNPRNLHS